MGTLIKVCDNMTETKEVPVVMSWATAIELHFWAIENARPSRRLEVMNLVKDEMLRLAAGYEALKEKHDVLADDFNEARDTLKGFANDVGQLARDCYETPQGMFYIDPNDASDLCNTMHGVARQFKPANKLLPE